MPLQLVPVFEEVTAKYNELKYDVDFLKEYHELLKNYVGRPSPIYFAKNLTQKLGGAKIYFKREDLNHTGTHKISPHLKKSRSNSS